MSKPKPSSSTAHDTTAEGRVSLRMMAKEPRYKRPFDLAILVVAHVLLFPIWLTLWTAIPIAIWIDDGRPIFYAHKRVGKNGKTFRMLKFRSMLKNAEDMTGPVWASEDDPRVTRVGRFLRDHALDELPQVLSLWKGDMSLVGPRAERLELVESFTQAWPEFSSRAAVRPGLTGLAQVFGRYDTDPRNKLRYDLLYIRGMGPFLDLKLLFKSVMITAKGTWEKRGIRR